MEKTVIQRKKNRKRRTLYIYPVSVINFQAQRGSIINDITSTIAPTKSIKSNECKSVKFEISDFFCIYENSRHHDFPAAHDAGFRIKTDANVKFFFYFLP